MKNAYTFTEIMVSLAIIGFITMLVLPIFFNTYGNKVVSAQLKKACTMITNAAKHVMVDERAKDIDSLMAEVDDNNLGFYYTSAGVKTSNDEQGAKYFLNKYFKHTMTDCGSGGSGKCIAQSYRTPQKVELGSIPEDFYCIRTPNDSAICMRYKTGFNKMEILIDVNGPDRPNISGSDVYVMWITNDGQLRDLDESASHCNMSSGIDDEPIMKYAAGCFHNIVSKSWNMREN